MTVTEIGSPDLTLLGSALNEICSPDNPADRRVLETNSFVLVEVELRRAACLAPSRAAFVIEVSAMMPRPSSNMPSTMSKNTGRTQANSTVAAPRRCDF